MAAVGGTAVGGTTVGGTAVGGAEVIVASTAVGGTDVLVGSTAATVVEVGPPDTWVGTIGGVPLAGSLQAVIAIENITSKLQVTMILFFMFSSLAAKRRVRC